MGSAATAPGVRWLCEGLRPPPTPYSLPPVSSFSHQGMVFRVADHAGIPLAGLSADGRVLSGFVPSKFINHSFVYDAPLPFYRPTIRLADKCRMAKAEAGQGGDGVTAVRRPRRGGLTADGAMQEGEGAAEQRV